tara:strand:+ start:675 stop:1442 length:768 start_codon:yes stop_codon:yes gene_type:complete
MVMTFTTPKNELPSTQETTQLRQDYKSYQNDIASYADNFKTETSFSTHLQYAESGSYSRKDQATVQNKKSGAYGPFQIMKSNEGTQSGYGITKNNMLKDRTNTKQATSWAHKYSSGLLSKFGNEKDAAAAYNWGPGNMRNWIKGGRKDADMPGETKHYIKRVMGDDAKKYTSHLQWQAKTSVENMLSKHVSFIAKYADDILGDMNRTPEEIDRWMDQSMSKINDVYSNLKNVDEKKMRNISSIIADQLGSLQVEP